MEKDANDVEALFLPSSVQSKFGLRNVAGSQSRVKSNGSPTSVLSTVRGSLSALPVSGQSELSQPPSVSASESGNSTSVSDKHL
uniref:Pecanex-like protein n=1 Tax=Rhabditophanes sp. KR3021 TaxID=114890 RepID=A0AC35U2S5_9BILA